MLRFLFGSKKPSRGAIAKKSNRRHSFRPVVELLEDRWAPARCDYTGFSMDSSNWNDPMNWSNYAVPGSGDDVWIADTSAPLGGGQAGLIHVPNGVVVQSLNINGASVVLDLMGTLHTGDVSFEAGAIQGNGSLFVGGEFSWYNGRLGGSAHTLIEAEARMTVLDLSSQTSDHRIADNHDLSIDPSGMLADYSFNGIEWIGGSPSISNQGEFIIYGHGGLRGPAPSGLLNSLRFTNYGTTRLVAEPNAAEYPDAAFDGVLFTNSGSLDIQQGMLWLNVSGEGTGTSPLSGSSSSITIGQDGALTFAGEQSFAQRGSTSGAGELAFEDTVTVTFNTPVSLGTITIAGWSLVRFEQAVQANQVMLAEHARLDGVGDVTASQQFSWLGGVMGGGGNTTVSDGVFYIAGDYKTLEDRDLWIGTQEGSAAQAVWTGYADILVSVRGFIHNFGRFTIQNDCWMYTLPTTDFQFFNAPQAVLRKAVPYTADQAALRDQGTRVTTLQGVAFMNSGAVELESGSLLLTGSGYLRGTYAIGARETLEFGQGTFSLRENAVFTGINGAAAGTLRLNADDCVLNVEFDTTIPRIELFRGLINGARNLTVTDYFNWSGGGMSGTGTTTIASGATLHFNYLNSAPKNFEDRLLNNFGQVSWAGHYLITRQSGSQDYSNAWVGDGILLKYLNVANVAWPAFTQALISAWNDLIAAEDAADEAYNAVVHAMDPLYDPYNPAPAPYRDWLTQIDDCYNGAIASINANASEEEYWDTVAAADSFYDDSRQDVMLGPNGFVTVEAQAYLNWRSAVDAARADYRTSVTTAYSNLQVALTAPNAPAAFPGHGDISIRASEIHALLQDPPHHPEIIPYLEALSPDARAALSVAYRRIFLAELGPYGAPDNGDLWTTLSYDPILRSRAIHTLFQGVPELPTTPSEETARNEGSRQTNGGFFAAWGSAISDFWRPIGQVLVDEAVVPAAEAIRDGAVAAWRETSGFVRDVTYLARNDPGALVSAVGEGLRDGAVITSNALTWELVPTLRDEAQRLVAENGGLYHVAAISATLSRELLVTSLTMGSAAAAQGGRVGWVASRLADHPRLVCAVTSASRAYQPIAAYHHVTGVIRAGSETMEAINRNDYGMAGLHMLDAALNAMGASASLRESWRMGRAMVQSASSTRLDPLRNYMLNCFAAGTPILGEQGARPIEEYRVGDKVWARDENDPAAPLVLREIEDCFESECPVWHLHVGGQVIRTTDEHPFWVDGKGWKATRELAPGDRIVGREGESAVVEEVFATGVCEKVYNFRVAEYHTYFVGEESWGFGLWAHNTCIGPTRPALRPGLENPLETVNGIKIWGEPQRTWHLVQGTWEETDHARRILERARQLAQGLGPDSYIVLNRSMRRGLDCWSGLGAAGGAKHPDILVVQYVGRAANRRVRVSAIEIVSPTNDLQVLEANLNAMKAALPPGFTPGRFTWE